MAWVTAPVGPVAERLMLAHWGDFDSEHSQEVDTSLQALDLISKLMSTVSTPTMVEFRDDSAGIAFGYAVGRERTVLTFQDTKDPPYYCRKH